MSSRARDRKRERYLLATGRGLTVRGPDVDRLVARIRGFVARGMSYKQIGQQVGLHQRTVSHLSLEDRQYMRRSVYEALSRARFEEPDENAGVDSTGFRRRLQALWAAGYPLPWLSDRLDFGSRSYLQQVVCGEKAVRRARYGNVRQVAEMYDKIADRDPVEMGVNQSSSTFARTWAAKRGLAPPRCWDPDTIDDPDAIPEWTGRCGTVFGWRIHQRQGIPACGPCTAAHDTEQPVLSPELLKAARLRKGLLLTDLGRLSGVNKATIQSWEAGRSIPRTPDVLERVLAVLDVTFEDVAQTEE